MPSSGTTAGIRWATAEDASQIEAIYAPVVRDTTISFELEVPSVEEIRRRIVTTLAAMPWLVAIDASERVLGYAYAGKHRERPAYQWSADVTVYVGAQNQRQGIGMRLDRALFDELVELGYCESFAGIALPNDASVALHQAVGFEPIGVYKRVGFRLGQWRDVGWWQRALQHRSKPVAPRLPDIQS